MLLTCPPLTLVLLGRFLVKKRPGPDALMYGVLLRLPSTHSFLSTLFSRLLLDDPDPTAKWCQSEIKLIYKDGIRITLPTLDQFC
jgi:hypothetical protein